MTVTSPNRRSSGAAGLVIAVFFLGLTLLAWTQRQAIYDWNSLRNYVPPKEIAQLAADTTMNEDARHMFYVYHPALNDRTQFAQNCGDTGEQTIVLGCYVSNYGIFLFDVDDPRLHGVEEVTAAHEMLHVAYDRLSPDERKKVDELTARTLESLNNDRIKKTVENYRQRDPSIVPNELHSILGTEVRDLPQDLENYYKKYFDNRSKVVEFSEKYESVLTERRNKVASLEIQLEGLKNEIELQEKSLNEQQEGLKRDRPNVKTQEQVVAYNQRVNSYNANIRELNNMIEQYNSLVEEYKHIAVETQELYKALDSRPTL